MEAIKDVPAFLNQLSFCDELNTDEIYEKIRCMKQCLVVDFEAYSIDKLVNLLDFVDDMNIMIVTNDLNDFHEEIMDLHEIIFYLISFKIFANAKKN